MRDIYFRTGIARAHVTTLSYRSASRTLSKSPKWATAFRIVSFKSSRTSSTVDSPLHKIYITSEIEKYLANCSFTLTAPLIISPSFSKMVYLNPLTEFWRGYNDMGVGNGTVAIIGFSFPEHDAYIEQPLYYLVDNFQNNTYYSSILTKTNLKMVDRKQTPLELAEYKSRYRFVDWTRTDTYLEGFDINSLDIIFEKP